MSQHETHAEWAKRTKDGGEAISAAIASQLSGRKQFVADLTAGLEAAADDQQNGESK